MASGHLVKSLGTSPGFLPPFLPPLETLSIPASQPVEVTLLRHGLGQPERGHSTGLLSFSGILVQSLHTSPPQVGSTLCVCACVCASLEVVGIVL